MKPTTLLLCLSVLMAACSCSKEPDPPAYAAEYRGGCPSPTVEGVGWDTMAFADPDNYTDATIVNAEVCGDVLIADVSYPGAGKHMVLPVSDGYTIRTSPPKRRVRLVDLLAGTDTTGLDTAHLVFNLMPLRVPGVHSMRIVLPNQNLDYLY